MGTKSVLPTIINRFFLYPLNKALLAVVVVLCLVINSFIPAFFVTTFNYDQFIKIINFQSVVFEYFSFTIIPMKILGSLFQDEMANTSNNSAPAKKQDHKTSPISDLSLVNIELNQNIGKYNGNKTLNFVQSILSINFTSLFSAVKQNCSDPPISPGSSLGIFLIFLFLLPRSNTSDAYASILNRVLGGTRLDRSSRVFYFPKWSLRGSKATEAILLFIWRSEIAALLSVARNDCHSELLNCHPELVSGSNLYPCCHSEFISESNNPRSRNKFGMTTLGLNKTHKDFLFFPDNNEYKLMLAHRSCGINKANSLVSFVVCQLMNSLTCELLNCLFGGCYETA